LLHVTETLPSESGSMAAPPAGPPRRRVASLTVGQTPRDDVLPDMLAQLPMALEVQEFGALDGLATPTSPRWHPVPARAAW
jgi:hypothetical protein